MLPRISKISTGCRSLDKLFGGYYFGSINLFYGTTGSGKTTLASYNAIGRLYLHLKEQDKLTDRIRFIVVDGDGGFDTERAEQIWEEMGADVGDINEKIMYEQPTEFAKQHTYITEGLEKTIDKEGLVPALISLDPMIAMYRGIILRADNRFKMSIIGQYTGKLDLQLKEIRKLCVKYGAVGLASTWPGSEVGKAMKKKDDPEPAKPPEVPFIGGRQFGFLCKTIVEIQVPDIDKTFRVAKLFKHRGRPVGGVCSFQLYNGGIMDV